MISNLCGMDTLTNETREYPVQPGLPLSVAAESTSAGSVSVAWLSAPGSSVKNVFTSGGETTAATFAATGESATWGIIPPTGTLAVTVTGTVKIAINPILD